MIKGLYIINSNSFNTIYTRENREFIEKNINIYAPPMSAEKIREKPEILRDAEVIFTGWGAPTMDKAFLKAASSLKAVFYGAGSVKHLVTDDFWQRGIKLTSAYAANAEPVAEFTLAQILFSLKRGWYYMNKTRETKAFTELIPMAGAYKSVIGIVSLGMIGRRVVELLQSFDLNIIAYDPFVTETQAGEMGVKLVSLEEIFIKSDVVSLHTPWLKETEGLINGKLFSMMKNGSTFINTARGAVVNEEEMINVLKKRDDLTALLDVTYPEPPVEHSPLYNMQNIFLTPHIAGSIDDECARMGYYMVEELKRFLQGEDFKWNITEEKSKIMA